METKEKNYPCRSVFVHQEDELTEIFTELWTQLINESEYSDSSMTKNAIL